jgi:hypothetical protein
MKGMLFVLLALAPSALRAAGSVDSTSLPDRCSLTIRSVPDSAWVFIDQERFGMTPVTIDSILPGYHVIRLLQADLSSWVSGAISDSLELGPGEQRTLQYAFDRVVYVSTDPSGARILLGDSVAGSTPLELRLPLQHDGDALTIDKPGYERALIPLSDRSSGFIFTRLEKRWQSTDSENPLLNESGPSSKTSLRFYLAGGATILSGVAAAYFKIKADDRNALYELTGDPALRDETHRLDTAAGISLLATEIGFALLTYYLLSD